MFTHCKEVEQRERLTWISYKPEEIIIFPENFDMASHKIILRWGNPSGEIRGIDIRNGISLFMDWVEPRLCRSIGVGLFVHYAFYNSLLPNK